MPQPRFDRLSERLLHAGIAPRHVRRYIGELADHFDDLAREELAGGAARELAETRALSRLGNDDDLAQAMLSRPELRSLTARYPWAVFAMGPVALLAVSVAAALYLEIGIIKTATVWAPVLGVTPGPAAAKWFTRAMLVWNTFAVFIAPLLFAALIYLVGSRQRISQAWIVTGVAIACVLGGFQDLVFYDTGCKGCGVLTVGSGLIPPFEHFSQGIARAFMNLAIAGGAWWIASRKKASAAMELHTARM